jgi:antitoxin component YwqK of YwqJK toxin-antitoxin module
MDLSILNQDSGPQDSCLPAHLLYLIASQIFDPLTFLHLSLVSSETRDLLLLPDLLKKRKKLSRQTSYLILADKTFRTIKLLPNGLQDGKEKFFRLDGTLKHSIMWEDGEKNGLEQTFHSDGRLWTQKTWESGILICDENWWDTETKRWHIKKISNSIETPNGLYIISYSNFSRLNRTGKKTRWDEDGRLQETIVWDKGLKTKLSEPQ